METRKKDGEKNDKRVEELAGSEMGESDNRRPCSRHNFDYAYNMCVINICCFFF